MRNPIFDLKTPTATGVFHHQTLDSSEFRDKNNTTSSANTTQQYWTKNHSIHTSSELTSSVAGSVTKLKAGQRPLADLLGILTPREFISTPTDYRVEIRPTPSPNRSYIRSVPRSRPLRELPDGITSRQARYIMKPLKVPEENEARVYRIDQ